MFFLPSGLRARIGIANPRLLVARAELSESMGNAAVVDFSGSAECESLIFLVWDRNADHRVYYTQQHP